MDTQTLLAIVAVLGGFALLVWGADRFVHGASATARNLGVSPLIIGLTIVGFGTSAPEMLVSASAALTGSPGLAVGNAVGSNITNIGLVLGVTALVMPLHMHSQVLSREYPVMFAVMLLTLVLVLDLQLSRADGLVLLAGLGVMTYWLISLGRRDAERDILESEYAAEIPSQLPMALALAWLVLGLAVLLLSSHTLVWGAVHIARVLGVSELVIGLTMVAVGTSLPELAASVMSALKGEPDIAIGNVIGSNMFNLLAVLGIPGVIAPLVLEPDVLSRDLASMIGLSILLFALAYGFRGDGRIGRAGGAVLLAAYGAYLLWLYRSITT